MIVKRNPTVLGTFVILIFVLPVSAQWQQLASPMPTPRSEMSAGYIDGKIYVPGGLGGLRRFEAYDVATDRWKSLDRLPAGRHHLMTVAHDNRIYVFGGADKNWQPTTSAWVYLPNINRWQSLSTLPEPRYAGAAISLGKFIYIVGGDGPTGRLLRYNPQRDVWTILASTRQRREHTGAVAFQGKIVVVGGRFRNRGELKSTEIYEVKMDRWYDGPDLTTARGGHATVVYRDRIYVFGGEVVMAGNKRTLKTSERLNNLVGQWQWDRDLPVPLHGMPMVSTDQALYLLGGSERAGAVVNRGLVYQLLD